MKRRTLFSALLLSAAFLPAAAARAQTAGVTLYEGVRLAGERASFDRDVFDLNETPFGARRASSVDVARGCRVTLFELSGYRGRSIELTERDNDLGNTRLGRGSVASLRVECGGAGGSGVTLFRDVDRKGPSQTFDGDVPDLEQTRIGARRASSIDVPPGCMATLYSEPGYRGRSATFREADNDLRNTPVGNDAAASLRVDCGRGPRGTRVPRPVQPGFGDTSGVTLFADRDFRGASQAFRYDVPDLAQTRIGARSASSLRLTPGCRATLFSEPNYRGRSQTFDAEHGNLRHSSIGNDAARSLRVECASRIW